jgi:integrating conjugative element protein (TIGR03757 family)
VKSIAVLLFALASQLSLAGSVTIFTNDNYPIQLTGAAAGRVVFPVINLDAMGHAKASLNKAVQSRLMVASGESIEERYRSAFNALLNSDEWVSHSTALEKANSQLVKALRMNITKVPAIVIDEKYVVYGVPSVEEALELYMRRTRP